MFQQKGVEGYKPKLKGLAPMLKNEAIMANQACLEKNNWNLKINFYHSAIRKCPFEKGERLLGKFGCLLRKTQAAWAFELKEGFPLKAVLELIGLP
ncbi:hypothetical protein POL88_15190 [Priestia megaterium]|uniref:hypothetical protein n=1 Tax=Priestia megaterium TaxID=1404 RepID=UPI00234F9E9C|nr:hypothetical protein [Priestia megaterium]MDC7770275.1 hypothetical protein [Priestia megaterium]